MLFHLKSIEAQGRPIGARFTVTLLLLNGVFQKQVLLASNKCRLKCSSIFIRTRCNYRHILVSFSFCWWAQMAISPCKVMKSFVLAAEHSVTKETVMLLAWTPEVTHCIGRNAEKLKEILRIIIISWKEAAHSSRTWQLFTVRVRWEWTGCLFFFSFCCLNGAAVCRERRAMSRRDSGSLSISWKYRVSIETLIHFLTKKRQGEVDKTSLMNTQRVFVRKIFREEIQGLRPSLLLNLILTCLNRHLLCWLC